MISSVASTDCSLSLSFDDILRMFLCPVRNSMFYMLVRYVVCDLGQSARNGMGSGNGESTLRARARDCVTAGDPRRALTPVRVGKGCDVSNDIIVHLGRRQRVRDPYVVLPTHSVLAFELDPSPAGRDGSQFQSSVWIFWWQQARRNNTERLLSWGSINAEKQHEDGI